MWKRKGVNLICFTLIVQVARLCLDRSRYSRFPITRTFMREIKKSSGSASSSYRESTALVLMAGVTMSYAVVRALEVTPCEDYM